MFPQQHDDPFIRFEYTYAPARDLGGDYVHVEHGPDGIVHVTLIDVTGHGLPAALTVNRLYGELERIRAESPLAQPGEVLSLLNRYIHLTLVKHNIFATALCLTLDPNKGVLHWSNAGHPPGYLRGANGGVTKLEATAVLLGALDAQEFNADQRTIELSPGDVIVAYTDGTFEARDRLGRTLGLSAIGDLMRIQPPPRNWPQFLASAVTKHSGGRTDDDILIAALTFKALRPAPVAPKAALAVS
jgi:sigma-B regulation protein RsbU (phosphoserine phosphatase)